MLEGESGKQQQQQQQQFNAMGIETETKEVKLQAVREAWKATFSPIPGFEIEPWTARSEFSAEWILINM